MPRNPTETKRKILEAATEEFAENGLAGTRMEAVAARAGVNKERVYNFAGTKDQIVRMVYGPDSVAAREQYRAVVVRAVEVLVAG